MRLNKRQQRLLIIIAKNRTLTFSDVVKFAGLCKDLHDCQYCKRVDICEYCEPIKSILNDLEDFKDNELIEFSILACPKISPIYALAKGKDLAYKYSHWFTRVGLWGKEHWNNPVVVILIWLASIIITAIITAYITSLFSK